VLDKDSFVQAVMRALAERILVYENWFPVELLNDLERERWEENMVQEEFGV